jgi:uncharacterized protein DUF4214
MFRSRTSSRAQSLHRFLFLALAIGALGLLLAPGTNVHHTQLKVPGAVASATSKSYQQFIRDAYQGAYGREPSCSLELEPEYNLMVNAPNSNALLAECQRFVATLFETQASYNAQDLTTYTQTAEYESRNAHDLTSYTDQERYVTDLYYAFLQRAPDSEGLAFWTEDVISEGRKKGIVAFVVCGEFEDLVNDLDVGSAPSCGGGCPECEDPCLGPGGHHNPICQ